MLRGMVILVRLNEEAINTCLYVASEIAVILKSVWFFQKTNQKKLSFSPADCCDLAGWENVADSLPAKTRWFLVWVVRFHFSKGARGGEVGLSLGSRGSGANLTWFRGESCCSLAIVSQEDIAANASSCRAWRAGERWRKTASAWLRWRRFSVIVGSSLPWSKLFLRVLLPCRASVNRFCVRPTWDALRSRHRSWGHQSTQQGCAPVPGRLGSSGGHGDVLLSPLSSRASACSLLAAGCLGFQGR